MGAFGSGLGQHVVGQKYKINTYMLCALF